MLEGVFDPSQFNPVMGGGKGLPVSDDKSGHLVVITSSNVEPTSDGSGTKLVLQLCILDGPHADETGNWNLNIGNASAQAERIAQQHLACICHAIGHLEPLQDTSVLHNRKFRVFVRQQAKKPEYTDVYDVRREDNSKLTDKPGSGSMQAANAAAGDGGFPAETAPVQQTATAQQQQAAPAEDPEIAALKAKLAAAEAKNGGAATGGFPADATTPADEKLPWAQS